MPLFTLVSLVLGIFGASHALMSALRSRYDSELRTIFSKYQDTVGQIKQACNSAPAASGAADAHATRICRRQKIWNIATGTTLWMFAIAVIGLSILALASDWSPPSVSQNAPVNQWILDNVTWVKSLMTFYLISVITCFICASGSSDVIASEYNALQEQLSTAVAAAQAITNQQIVESK